MVAWMFDGVTARELVPGVDSRAALPAGDPVIHRHFAHGLLAAEVEHPQERAHPAVAFVEREAVLDRLRPLPDRQLPLRLVALGVGNPRRPTASRSRRPQSETRGPDARWTFGEALRWCVAVYLTGRSRPRYRFA